MPKNRKRPWTTTEIRVIKSGKIPEGRSYHATQVFCCRMGLKFPGVRFQENENFNKKVKNA